MPPPDDSIPPPDDSIPPPDDNQPPPDDNQPPPDDGLTGIVWGGLPAGAQGIFIVDGIPADGAAAEGIIILHGKGVSQVMGISMGNKTGGDGSANSIVLQNLPAPESTKGAVWTGIIWGGMPGSGPDTQGMILIGGMPCLKCTKRSLDRSASWFWPA